AMGIVLIYRATRAINFAQAEIGGLAAAIAVVMVTGSGLPYGLAVPLGLLAAMATGAVIDLIVIRRLWRAPRLIVTVATIGVAQLLGAAEIGLPKLWGHLRPLSTFTAHFSIGPILFRGHHIVAICADPAVLAALVWFLIRSDTGTAVRAAADSD